MDRMVSDADLEKLLHKTKRMLEDEGDDQHQVICAVVDRLIDHMTAVYVEGNETAGGVVYAMMTDYHQLLHIMFMAGRVFQDDKLIPLDDVDFGEFGIEDIQQGE